MTTRAVKAFSIHHATMANTVKAIGALRFAYAALGMQEHAFGGRRVRDAAERLGRFVEGLPGASDAMMTAAYLTDTVSAEVSTLEEIRSTFGARVAALVEGVTPLRREDGEKRFQWIEREMARINSQTKQAKRIVLAKRMMAIDDMLACDDAKAAAFLFHCYLDEAVYVLAAAGDADADLARQLATSIVFTRRALLRRHQHPRARGNPASSGNQRHSGADTLAVSDQRQ